MSLKPFEQLAFDELPDEPERPHPFFEMETRRLAVSCKAFGAVDTHLRSYGNGPPLLLVHGLMTSSYSWRYVLEPLERHFTLYVPDLPGAGRSQKPLEPAYSPQAFARWLAALQRELDIYGCPVIGNSLGGYLCMWLALNEPDAIARLVNLHSPALPLLRLRALHALLAVPGTQRLTAWLARRNPEKWAHKNVHYYDETIKSLEEAREYGRPLSTPAGSMAFAKTLAETLAPSAFSSFCAELDACRLGDGFPVPLRLIYAKEDVMVPPEVGEKLGELIPDADLVWLDEASHFAHVDATDRFLEAALPFLKASNSTLAG